MNRLKHKKKHLNALFSKVTKLVLMRNCRKRGKSDDKRKNGKYVHKQLQFYEDFGMDLVEGNE